jgi:predicted CoA-binding protein
MDSGKKKTMILGASGNPTRYSYLALNRLREKGHPVVAIGSKKTQILDVTVETDRNQVAGVDTVTLYINPDHQKEYYDYILSLQPKRLIFNPGAENKELADLAEKAGIKPVEACTLVLLSTGQF